MRSSHPGTTAIGEGLAIRGGSPGLVMMGSVPSPGRMAARAWARAWVRTLARVGMPPAVTMSRMQAVTWACSRVKLGSTPEPMSRLGGEGLGGGDAVQQSLRLGSADPAGGGKLARGGQVVPGREGVGDGPAQHLRQQRIGLADHVGVRM